MKLLIEKSQKGLNGFSFPEIDVPQIDIESTFGKENLRNSAPELPEVSEPQVIRHFTLLSQQNYGLDSGFYPLGSCTMKYNPKINEETAKLEGFTTSHPLASEKDIQGSLELMYRMEKALNKILGVSATSLAPMAGSHGELTGLMIIKKYHESQGNIKTKILIPDSAHGTNPASASMCGYKVIQVKSNEKGCVDVNSLKELMDDDAAGLMLTNPNTLGLFEEDIQTISKIVHEKGGLLYYDGANLNAIMGKVRPGDMGFDAVHINLHKTFSTPHGGGGPGSGPLGVSEKLVPFLPNPIIEKTKNNEFKIISNSNSSIGKISGFYGNFLVIVKAFTYILALGEEGLKEISDIAVLNANYMMRKLEKKFFLPYKQDCMHEFVISSKIQNEKGIHTVDIAKFLLDNNFHAPTIYFPLIVPESMMIEPTETESKETLDNFIKIMEKAADLTETKPEILLNSPVTTTVKRLDETNAARKPNICCFMWEEN